MRHRSTSRRASVVVFERDTISGRAFDVGLLLVIGLSVLTVMLESVASIRESHGSALRAAELGLVVLRALPLLRVFQVLKLVQGVSGADDAVATSAEGAPSMPYRHELRRDRVMDGHAHERAASRQRRPLAATPGPWGQGRRGACEKPGGARAGVRAPLSSRPADRPRS